jgi:hypothetical protein
MELLAFGGPWNERLISVPAGRDVVLAPLPVNGPTGAAAELEPGGASYRHGEYRVEKVGYHDDRRCDHLSHSTCGWTGRCLVFHGYPAYRITDALNVIAALARLGWVAAYPSSSSTSTGS